MVREGVVAAGVVSLSGIPTQNQTLAVNVTDVDGISAGAPIVYRWQHSADNGVTWFDILGEATGSLSCATGLRRQARTGRRELHRCRRKCKASVQLRNRSSDQR